MGFEEKTRLRCDGFSWILLKNNPFYLKCVKEDTYIAGNVKLITITT